MLHLSFAVFRKFISQTSDFSWRFKRASTSRGQNSTESFLAASCRTSPFQRRSLWPSLSGRKVSICHCVSCSQGVKYSILKIRLNGCVVNCILLLHLSGSLVGIEARQIPNKTVLPVQFIFVQHFFSETIVIWHRFQKSSFISCNFKVLLSKTL